MLRQETRAVTLIFCLESKRDINMGPKLLFWLLSEI